MSDYYDKVTAKRDLTPEDEDKIRELLGEHPRLTLDVATGVIAVEWPEPKPDFFPISTKLFEEMLMQREVLITKIKLLEQRLRIDYGPQFGEDEDE